MRKPWSEYGCVHFGPYTRAIERKQARKNYVCDGCGEAIWIGDLYWWGNGGIRICDASEHWPSGYSPPIWRKGRKEVIHEFHQRRCA